MLDKVRKVGETALMKLPQKRLIYLLFAAALVIGLAVFGYQHFKRAPNVKASKTLIVITHNAPGTYFVNGAGEYAGLDYDLANLFLKDLGEDYKIKFVVAGHVSQILPMLKAGKGHFAAANLSITPERAKKVKFSAAYLTVQEHIVYGIEQNDEPKTISDLIGKHIHIPAGSSYAERLKALQADNPKLAWQEVTSGSTDELLEQVTSGFLDYTIADDHMISLMQNFYPNLGKGFAVGGPEHIAWAFPKKNDPWLYQKSLDFFKRIEADGTLKNLVDRYYGHVERLNPVDVSKFLELTRSLLPKYATLFKTGQELTDIDWRLLAAISYQESHWDQYNTSPTNVRGMMMLTEDTADELGVTDRLDAKQSILGGARYINQLKKQIPERIPEPDRTWMTLAAYNIGFSHLEDARVLAEKKKLNPDSWADVKTTLPLLNKAEYYREAKFGYANGGAPVIFVESIRTYFDILGRYAPAHQPLLPNLNFNPTFK